MPASDSRGGEPLSNPFNEKTCCKGHTQTTASGSRWLRNLLQLLSRHQAHARHLPANNWAQQKQGLAASGLLSGSSFRWRCCEAGCSFLRAAHRLWLVLPTLFPPPVLSQVPDLYYRLKVFPNFSGSFSSGIFHSFIPSSYPELPALSWHQLLGRLSRLIALPFTLLYWEAHREDMGKQLFVLLIKLCHTLGHSLPPIPDWQISVLVRSHRLLLRENLTVFDITLTFWKNGH